MKKSSNSSSSPPSPAAAAAAATAAAATAKITAEQPPFRFAQIQSQQQQQAEIPRIGGSKFAAGESSSQKSAPPPPFPPFASAGAASGSSSARDELIDKNLYFNANADDQQQQFQDDSESSLGSSNWYPTDLRTVPAFYPLEKSTRLVEDESANGVASRLSECLRYLSVQADYDNETATANLLTSENVEMCLSLWKTSHTSQQKGVLVELQRRKGDSIAFHRYSRHILDAAVGDLDIADIPDDMLNDKMYSKKVQRLLAMELKNQENQEHENAIIALEIAHSLLMKDRMDARRLGLESLCLLTDPRKTGYTTAVLTSHVVLLGSTQGIQVPGVGGKEAEDLMLVDEAPFQEIREAILSLVQFSRIGEDEFDEEDVNAALSPDAEQMTLLHNLALAVLANALDVVENPERYEIDPEDSKPSASSSGSSHSRSRLRTASSSDVTNEFLQQTEEVSNKELLSTLIGELGKAHQKPHNATLSAKCLGSLCRASDEAKRRAKELGAKNVVSTALDVGVRTHLKLETECKKVVQALERLDNEDGSNIQQQRQQQQQQQEVAAAAARGQPPPPPPAAAAAASP